MRSILGTIAVEFEPMIEHSCIPGVRTSVISLLKLPDHLPLVEAVHAGVVWVWKQD